VRLPWARFLEVIFKRDRPFRAAFSLEGKRRAYRVCHAFPINALSVMLKEFLWRFLKQRSVPAVEKARMRN